MPLTFLRKISSPTSKFAPFSPAEPDFSELHPRDDSNRFSWSGRFAPSLPRPREEYTSAQRHSHFRSYFGYLPGEDGNGNKSSTTRAAAGGSRQSCFCFRAEIERIFDLQKL